MSTASYSRIPAPGNPRLTEGWALIEAARRLAIGLERYASDSKTGREPLREALRLNWRLWTIFQAELTVERPEMPGDLRGNMLSLCQFVDRQTVACLAELDPEKILPMIEVNRNIASGLMQLDDQNASAPAAPTAAQSEPGSPIPAMSGPIVV